jgi:integrase
VDACERALKLFEQHTGNPPIQQITRAQGDSFRSWLQQQGSSTKTAHDRLTWVKSLFKYAYRDLEAIDRHPWEGIDIEYRTEKPRRPWTAEQLKAFFALPLFTSYALPSHKRAGADAAYWIPLLGLYHGARVGELCQLRVDDVIQEAGGASIRISEDAEGATVKTEAGLRTVPLHSELVRLGFLDYVETMKRAKVTSLWPKLPLRKGKPGGYFSEWFGTVRAEVPEGVPDFHSLRHTVRTAMTEAGIAETVQDRITGHEIKGSMGSRVYAHPTVVLRRAVESIRYASLQLAPVYLPTNA